jgi:hypothetical protein
MIAPVNRYARRRFSPNTKAHCLGICLALFRPRDTTAKYSLATRQLLRARRPVRDSLDVLEAKLGRDEAERTTPEGPSVQLQTLV